MADLQDQFDDGMFDFSTGDYDAAIAKFKAILAEEPDHLEAQLSLGMALFRKGEIAKAIEEGHKAEKLDPKEQRVHTNLSLFYVKAGDKEKAEHHGLQAKLASWKTDTSARDGGDPELGMQQKAPAPVKITGKLPDMPWKKK